MTIISDMNVNKKIMRFGVRLTLKIWHRFSRALSRNSWVFFKHSPLSSGSAPTKLVLMSDEPTPNQDRKELLAAASLE